MFFSLIVHPTIAIFELGLTFNPRMMLPKFHDDISNGSGVKHPDRQLDRQTDKQSHKQTLLKTMPPSLHYTAVLGQ